VDDFERALGQATQGIGVTLTCIAMVADKELANDLAQHGVELVFAHLSESLKADLDHLTQLPHFDIFSGRFLAGNRPRSLYSTAS
jgi:hypothetical protein